MRCFPLSNVIELKNVVTKVGPIPENLFSLRWRFKMNNGYVVCSAWTPETRYPSISGTLRNYEKDIDTVFIDARSKKDRANKMTLLQIPYEAMREISYKGVFSMDKQKTAVIGIEVEDWSGNRYLAMIDGNVFTEGNVKNG